MKTIVDNITKQSVYVFDDSEIIKASPNFTLIGSPVVLTITDCNSENTAIIDDVTPPADWVGRKYLYDGAWQLNPDYQERPIAENVE